MSKVISKMYTLPNEKQRTYVYILKISSHTHAQVGQVNYGVQSLSIMQDGLYFISAHGAQGGTVFCGPTIVLDPPLFCDCLLAPVDGNGDHVNSMALL